MIKNDYTIYNNGAVDTTDNYFKLALTVQKLAAIDYINILRYIRKHRDECDSRETLLSMRKAQAEKRNIEKAIREGLFANIFDFNADKFISKLKYIASQDDAQVYFKKIKDEEFSRGDIL